MQCRGHTCVDVQAPTEASIVRFSLKLGLQMVGSCLWWVPEIKLGSSQKAAARDCNC